MVGLLSFSNLFSAEEKSYFPREDMKMKKSSSSIKKIEKNVSVRMSNPSFSGELGDNVHYIINAQEATKLEDNKYSLSEIEGIYDIKNRKILVYAKFGEMDNSKKSLLLQDKVFVKYRNFDLETQEIKINPSSLDIKTDKNVELRMLDNIIHAKGLESNDNMNEIHFLGRVRSEFVFGKKKQ